MRRDNYAEIGKSTNIYLTARETLTRDVVTSRSAVSGNIGVIGIIVIVMLQRELARTGALCNYVVNKAEEGE